VSGLLTFKQFPGTVLVYYKIIIFNFSNKSITGHKTKK